MISVIIPLYKGKRFIPKLIDMFEQNAKKVDEKVEIIFINDFPGEEINETFSNPYLDIKLINNEKNYGIHFSRVRGIHNASGKYIYMLDQDDEIRDHFFLSQLRHIQNGDGDIVVANGYEEYNGNRRILYRWRLMQQTVKYKIFHIVVGCRIISPGQCLIKKDAISPLWTNNIITNNGADDFFLWMILLKKHKKVVINRDRLYIHKYTGDNTSLNTEKMNASVNEVLNIFKSKNILTQNEIRIIKNRMEGKGIVNLIGKGIERIGNIINGRR